jgi:ubiquinone/menaquinone biosynthesis C-methylase UbiE
VRVNTTIDDRALWVTRRRFGGSAEALAQTNSWVAPIVRRVVDGAQIRAGDHVLDIASRDGLVAAEAFSRLGSSGTLTMTEISEELIGHLRQQLREDGIDDRCRVIKFPPVPFAGLADESVDAATMRSALAYMGDPVAVLSEVRRVLRPAARFSTIQMFGETEIALNGRYFMGYDVSPIPQVMKALQARAPAAVTESDVPAFDERDIVGWFEQAGFTTFDLTFELEASDTSSWPPPDWELAIDMSGGPGSPTIREIMTSALTDEEAAEFEACLRPQVEGGRRRVRFRRAYVVAVK